MATVLFFPEGAFGPTNNCVGIGDVLRSRGHRVVFLVEESFAGTLDAQGFEERLMRLGPPPAEPEAPGQFWKDFVRDTAEVFRRPTIEQLEGFVAPTFAALCDGARFVEARLREVLDELDPDVVVEDNVVTFPALPGSGRPWVRVMSCNPLEFPDASLPPTFSGYPTVPGDGDARRRADFRAEARRVLGPLHDDFDAFCRGAGAPPLPDLQFLHESRWANVYAYPDEVNYPRSVAPAATWHNVQATVRATDPAWDVPAAVAQGDGPLVYVSLGSLGSADVALLQQVVDALAGRCRAVVSLGPLHDQVRLPDGMVGEEFLPQTSVLPHVDAVVTHGGNNTVLECLHAGLPMVVLPLFWDQHDNAQRIDETGYGVRLPTYDVDAPMLTSALDRLLHDDARARRAHATAARLRAAVGTAHAADVVERVATAAVPA